MPGFCFSSPCEPLCPHRWILQRQVSVLHTLSLICSYSEELCRLLCSALTPLPSVCPLVFGFLISFFSGYPEMLKELLTTWGKLSETFQTERLLAAAFFPMPCSFLLEMAEKPGSLAHLLLMLSVTTCESGAACSCHSRTR